MSTDDLAEFLKRANETQDEHDARELRRIEFRKLRRVATWDDHRREHDIGRRMADREFERRERERG